MLLTANTRYRFSSKLNRMQRTRREIVMFLANRQPGRRQFTGSSSLPNRHSRLSLEALEVRSLLTTLSVDIADPACGRRGLFIARSTRPR